MFRGLDPEEPVTSSAYLCAFHDLEITGVFMDDIMQQPDQVCVRNTTQLS